MLEGKVVTTGNVDVEGINIINKSLKTGTITDENGNFRIAASLNDSIAVSAVHVEETIVIISKDQLSDKKIIIQLSEKTNFLSEVTLRRPLTGYIGSDTNIIPLKEIVTASSIGLPKADMKKLTKSESLLYAATSGPMDMLINTLTGETKRLKKRLELEKNIQITESLLDKFPMTYFVDVLKIDQFKVYPFLFFCEEDPDYKTAARGDSMQIMDFLERKSKEFRQNLEKEE